MGEIKLTDRTKVCERGGDEASETSRWQKQGFVVAITYFVVKMLVSLFKWVGWSANVYLIANETIFCC